MKRLPMSRAAAGLLRGLLARVGAKRDRILLSEVRSVDWQSLTFVGERHLLRFAICGPDAADLFERMGTGLADAEFAMPGQIVADVGVTEPPVRRADGWLCFAIEALTIAE